LAIGSFNINNDGFIARDKCFVDPALITFKVNNIYPFSVTFYYLERKALKNLPDYLAFGAWGRTNIYGILLNTDELSSMTDSRKGQYKQGNNKSKKKSIESFCHHNQLFENN
jgi:hypothetical protein